MPKGRSTSDDGTALPADLVIVGIRVRPDTRLAEAAGLQVANGVLVNEFLGTSVPGIFAAGDIARYPGPADDTRIRVEHWVAAQRQGQAAARSIVGRRLPFTDPPFFWTRQWDVGIAYTGHTATWDEVRIEGDPAAGDAAVHYLSAGEVRAVATLGRDLQNLRTEAAMQARAARMRAARVGVAG